MDKDVARKQWEKRLDEFKKSNMSIAEWCRTNNVKINTFRYWLNKDKYRSMEIKASNWIPLNINSNKSHDKTLTVKIGCAVIDVHENFDKVLFQEIVTALKTIC